MCTPQTLRQFGNGYSDIVDCCHVWESHRDVEIEPQISADRRPARAVCQVTVDKQIPTTSAKTENLEDIISMLLPTSALRPPQAAPIPSDRDILIQQLMEAICPPTPVAQERSAATEWENFLLNCFRSEQSRCFARSVGRFRRGMFFMRGVDPYDGPVQDS